MGWELILAMALASALTRAFEHSRRRAAAEWEAARAAAAERRAERARQRSEAAQVRAQRVQAARAKGPRDPLWWPLAAGWLAAAAMRGGVAAVKGAREGAVVGAAEGARLGRTAAREGWTLARTWREYRRQRAADTAQTERRRDQARRATAGVEADADTVASTGEGHTPPPGASCAGCGQANLADLVATTSGAYCAACLGRRAGASAADAVPDDTGPGPDACRTPPPIPPLMVPCTGCGTAITDTVAGLAGGRCADCAHPDPDPRPTPPGDQAGSGADPDPNTTEEVVDAELVDDPLPTTTFAIEGSTHTMSEPNTMQAISLNGAALSGGDGEGYTSTITALGQVAELLERVTQVVTDLGDVLTSKHVDQATLSHLNDLDDQLQAATTTTTAALTHARAKHEPVAAAIAGAGGSQEVADTDWYDDL